MYKKIDDWINEKILDGSIEYENTVSNINQEVMKFKKIPELDFESNKNFSGFYQILLRMAFDWIYRLKSALFSVFQCTPIRYNSAIVSG